MSRAETEVATEAIREELWVGDDIHSASQRAGTSYHTLRVRLAEAGIEVRRPRILVAANGDILLPPSIQSKLEKQFARCGTEE